MPAAEREQSIRLVLSSELDGEDGPSIMGMYHGARVHAQRSSKVRPECSSSPKYTRSIAKAQVSEVDPHIGLADDTARRD